MLKPIALGTAVAGTLDILFAMILTIAFGSEIGNMLRRVGSGPFPQAVDMGAAGSILGLLVHFVLVARSIDDRAPVPMPPEIDAVDYWPLDGLPLPISDFTKRRVRDAARGARPTVARVERRVWRT